MADIRLFDTVKVLVKKEKRHMSHFYGYNHERRGFVIEIDGAGYGIAVTNSRGKVVDVSYWYDRDDLTPVRTSAKKRVANLTQYEQFD